MMSKNIFRSPRVRSAALRWFIDTLALAGAGMAGVYVGVWLDPPNSNPNPVDTEETK